MASVEPWSSSSAAFTTEGAQTGATESFGQSSNNGIEPFTAATTNPWTAPVPTHTTPPADMAATTPTTTKLMRPNNAQMPSTTTSSSSAIAKQNAAILANNASYARIQERMLQIDAANLLIDKNIERQTGRMATLAKAKLQLLVVCVVLLVFFLYQQYVAITKKWKNLMQQLESGPCNADPAHRLALTTAPFFGPALPSFVECSPFFLALCLEYPFLSSLKFANTSFPLAVKYAYTSSCYSCIMSKIDGPFYAGATHIPKIFEVSQMCTLRSNSGTCNAEVICCEAFKQIYMSRKVNPRTCFINPLYPDQCFPTCQVDQYPNLENNTSAAAVSAGIQMGTGGAFAAHSIGSSLGQAASKTMASSQGLSAEEASAAESRMTAGVSAVLMIGTAVGMGYWGAQLQRQSVSDAQEDCQKSLTAQLCLGKAGFCQAGTAGDLGGSAPATSAALDIGIAADSPTRLAMTHHASSHPSDRQKNLHTIYDRYADILRGRRQRAEFPTSLVEFGQGGSSSSSSGENSTQSAADALAASFREWPVQGDFADLPGGGIAFASCYMTSADDAVGSASTPYSVQQALFSDPSGIAYAQCCFARNSCLPKTCVGADTQMCYSNDPVLAGFFTGRSGRSDLANLWQNNYQNCVMTDTMGNYYIATCDRPLVQVGQADKAAGSNPDRFLSSGEGQLQYCGNIASNFGTREYVCPQSFWGCDSGVVASLAGIAVTPAPSAP